MGAHGQLDVAEGRAPLADDVEEVLFEVGDLAGRDGAGEILGLEGLDEGPLGTQLGVVLALGQIALRPRISSASPCSLTVLPTMQKVRPMGISASTWVVSVISRSVETFLAPVQVTRRG
jgi:hypothetical protein